MSLLRSILTQIDIKLDSMIKHPVIFVGTRADDDEDEKLQTDEDEDEKSKTFYTDCMAQGVSNEDICEELDEWLKVYDDDGKIRFCSRMYRIAPSTQSGQLGRYIIEEYCESNHITLNR